jgi:MarR family transcriptional regulator, lower aerobic nicotinate degradation pathway regulator
MSTFGLRPTTVDPQHKRRNIVTLTPAGGEQLRDLDTVVDAIQDELLAPLTATQRRQFVTLMSRLLDGSGPRQA